MLSSVLTSKRAIQVNIQIVRAFIKLRQLLVSNEELRQKVLEMEQKYDKNFKAVFDLLNQLLIQEETPKHPMGFIHPKPEE